MRLRLEPATRRVGVFGPQPDATAVAIELKARLAALISARDSGDPQAFAEAVGGVNRLLDRVEIEWALGGER